MANRVVAPNLFAPNPPNWSLQLLDANANNATGAINDSSLGSVNGPLADTGSANNYQVTCTYGSPSALNNGMTVFFTPANTNTGPSTLTVSPLSSAPIVSTSSTALAGGELAAGTTIGVVYDGTQFRIFNLPSPSSIWSVRLRSYNSIGNCNFEVDQRNCNTSVTFGTGSVAQIICDRWVVSKSLATGTAFPLCQVMAGPASLPGTNYAITRSRLLYQVTVAQASLAAGEYIQLQQFVEGPQTRELFNDVTSLQLMVSCGISPLHFSVAIRDQPVTRSIVYLCTYNVPAGQSQLITIPNIPVFPAANFSTAPGVVGYSVSICLASGSTLIAPSLGAWNTGNFIGATGMDNFAANAGQNFFVYFVQHEPGPVCTTPMDLDFDTNLLRCQRYFSKSYDYGTKPGTIANDGACVIPTFASQSALAPIPFKKIMAKVPTLTIYSPVTGASGNVRDLSAAVDRVTTGPFYLGDSGFSGFSITTPNAAQCFIAGHYIADTSW